MKIKLHTFFTSTLNWWGGGSVSHSSHMGSSENPLRRRTDSFGSWSGCTGNVMRSKSQTSTPHTRIIGLFKDTFVPASYKSYQIKLNMVERSFSFLYRARIKIQK